MIPDNARMNGRGFNWQIWAGLLLSLGGYSSWNLFLKWPITRDVPWANLLLFGLAAWMLVAGVRRAFEADSVHPLKVMAIGGVVVASMASCALFLLVRFVWAVGSAGFDPSAPGRHSRARILAAR